MLKKTLANYLFLGLLSSVKTEGDYRPNDFHYRTSFIGSFKDKCSELLDQSACVYWNSLQDDGSDFQSTKTSKSQQDQPNSENGATPGKQSMEENSEEKFLANGPFVDPGNNINKRFYVFRRRNPNPQGYKRGPGFRSWGGKRDSQSAESPFLKKTKLTSWNNFFDEAKANEKRSKFVSWGGKRGFDYSSNKRTGFRSWGGKRDIPPERIAKKDAEILSPYRMDKRSPIWKDLLYLDEPYKKHFPKRPQFQSWGGKRAVHPLHRFLALFYARPFSILNGEKRKFSSWGGKRSYENQYDNFWEEMRNELKRHNFQSWGGKRASDEESQDANQTEEQEIVKTNSKNKYSDLGSDIWRSKRDGGR